MHVANFGTMLSASTKSPYDRGCLEVFAELLNLEADGLRPHLFAVLLEPTGGVQILTVGHACPGLTVQVGEDHQLDLIQLWFGENEQRAPRPGPNTSNTGERPAL
jgi:hypothetical protein